MSKSTLLNYKTYLMHRYLSKRVSNYDDKGVEIYYLPSSHFDKGTLGQYDPKIKAVEINSDVHELEIENSLIHELTHYAQWTCDQFVTIGEPANPFWHEIKKDFEDRDYFLRLHEIDARLTALHFQWIHSHKHPGVISALYSQVFPRVLEVPVKVQQGLYRACIESMVDSEFKDEVLRQFNKNI